jgi:hypothetical protein
VISEGVGRLSEIPRKGNVASPTSAGQSKVEALCDSRSNLVKTDLDGEGEAAATRAAWSLLEIALVDLIAVTYRTVGP